MLDTWYQATLQRGGQQEQPSIVWGVAVYRVSRGQHQHQAAANTYGYVHGQQTA